MLHIPAFDIWLLRFFQNYVGWVTWGWEESGSATGREGGTFIYSCIFMIVSVFVKMVNKESGLIDNHIFPWPAVVFPAHLSWPCLGKKVFIYSKSINVLLGSIESCVCMLFGTLIPLISLVLTIIKNEGWCDCHWSKIFWALEMTKRMWLSAMRRKIVESE